MTQYTTVPVKTDRHWRDVVTGKIAVPWQMLAMKIMMMRIVNAIKTDPSPANVDKCALELHSFFEKNLKMAQADLTSIFG